LKNVKKTLLQENSLNAAYIIILNFFSYDTSSKNMQDAVGNIHTLGRLLYSWHKSASSVMIQFDNYGILKTL
jgi:hypothetical protein